MLYTSKSVLFPGHNHLLTTGTDDLTLWLWLTGDYWSEGSSALMVSRLLWPGNRTFLEVVSWWIVHFFAHCLYYRYLSSGLISVCWPIDTHQTPCRKIIMAFCSQQADNIGLVWVEEDIMIYLVVCKNILRFALLLCLYVCYIKIVY